MVGRARLGVGRGVSVGIVLAAVLFALAADAKSSPVALGEVKNRADEGDVRVDRTFRSAVEAELRSLDLSNVHPSERYVLSATLTKMDVKSRKRQAESTAVVSATLRSARGGALRAIIEGRAKAVEDGESASVKESAVRGAVRSAFRRVPEALR